LNSVIKVRGLTKRFGDFTAVDQVDMTIPERAVYGFLGPNGSGKTTAIRMMCGLLKPTAGDIEVLGMRIPEQTEAVRLQVGYMTQRFSMYGDLTVKQNLQFIGKIMGVTGQDLSQRLAELAEEYQLAPILGNLAGSLSGGQKRRIALAAATIHRPRLLLLDEPTSEVDPNTRREFWDQLFRMCTEGTTILVTTHLMDEAERCHHLAVIDAGKKVADGTPDDLKTALDASTLEIRGPHIEAIRQRLDELPSVLSATQVGMNLRVLVDRSQPEPGRWLTGQLEAFTDTAVLPSEPNIEDVFVMATRSGQAV